MRRRRGKRSSSGLTKPLVAVVLLALMWVALQFDLYTAVSRALLAPLAGD